MLRHPLDGCRAKLERVSGQLLEVRRRVLDHQANGYKITKRLVAPDEIELVIDDVQDAPLELSILIGELAYNLRSCLDQLVWALISQNGNTPSERSAFPVIFKTGTFPSLSDPRVRGVTSAQLSLIEALQPYHAQNPSNSVLWSLHQSNNFDKHRLVLTVERSNSVVIGKAYSEGRAEFQTFTSILFGQFEAGHQIVKLKVPDGVDPASYIVEFDPQCLITFDRSCGAVANRPVFKALAYMVGFMYGNVFLKPGFLDHFPPCEPFLLPEYFRPQPPSE